MPPLSHCRLPARAVPYLSDLEWHAASLCRIIVHLAVLIGSVSRLRHKPWADSEARSGPIREDLCSVGQGLAKGYFVQWQP